MKMSERINHITGRVHSHLQNLPSWSRTRKAMLGTTLALTLLAAAAVPLTSMAAEKNAQTFRHHFSPNQIADQMAGAFGVSKDTLVKYYLDGTSFRDLGHAAMLAHISGKSLDEVLTLRTGGQDWKTVASTLGVTPDQMKAARQQMIAGHMSKKLSLDEQTVTSLLSQGYNPRDIAVASVISQETSKPIADILSLKTINNTWESVAQSQGVDAAAFRQDLKKLHDAFPGARMKHHGQPMQGGWQRGGAPANENSL